MSVVAVLILASMLVAGGFLLAFLWAVRSGQFDDGYTPSVRVLFDDAPATAAPRRAAPSPTPSPHNTP